MANLNKREREYFDKLKMRLGCSLGGCGTYFKLEIGEVAATKFEEKKKKYSGKCSKCHKNIVLLGTEIDRFEKTMGIPTIQVIKTTFDQFFTEK